jgi:hypothetical protein
MVRGSRVGYDVQSWRARRPAPPVTAIAERVGRASLPAILGLEFPTDFARQSKVDGTLDCWRSCVGRSINVRMATRRASLGSWIIESDQSPETAYREEPLEAQARS